MREEEPVKEIAYTRSRMNVPFCDWVCWLYFCLPFDLHYAGLDAIWCNWMQLDAFYILKVSQIIFYPFSEIFVTFDDPERNFLLELELFLIFHLWMIIYLIINYIIRARAATSVTYLWFYPVYFIKTQNIKILFRLALLEINMKTLFD